MRLTKKEITKVISDNLRKVSTKYILYVASIENI